MKTWISKGSALTMVLGSALAFSACGPEKAPERAAPASTAGHEHSAQSAPAALDSSQAVLTQVASRDRVCMVTNRLFTSPQIPVEVQGTTYYGCCEGCKARLAEDPAAREDVDPVSGRKVDKARAVIGALPDGRVIYFENAENLRAWTPSHGGIPKAG